MKNDKWLELTNGVCWSMIFSLAAIIMSIVSLADTHPRVLCSADDKTVVLGFDYIGVIVAILALLVTFLVAWQIWQTINSDRRIKELEQKLNDNENLINARVCFSQGLFLVTSYLNSDDNKALGNLCVAYRNFLQAIKHFLQSSKDVTSINSCLENMEKCLDKIEKAKFEFTKTVGSKCDIIFEEMLLMELLTSDKLHQRLTNLNKKRTGN